MSTRQAALDRHDRLVLAHTRLLNALTTINEVPTRDLHRGNFIEWFKAIEIMNGVEHTLASLLHPSSTELKPNQPTKGD